MLFHSLLLAGATALTAQAYLVIPETRDETHPVGSPDGHGSIQQVTLNCTECPFRQADGSGNASWVDDFETTLVCRIE